MGNAVLRRMYVICTGPVREGYGFEYKLSNYGTEITSLAVVVYRI